jgi:LuxR family maltose regulon positive regulatory protein
MLDHLPENMHLVLSGRVDPLLHLSRLRVGGQLIEIRQNDLRFTKAEVAVFLNDLMGLDLSPEDIAALDARTEGWIASLQLAALSLQGRQDRKELIAAFAGSHYYIIDYLVDEVLSCQPEEIQTFLRETSILERFCAPLCDAVLGTEASRQILYQLEGANLFLVPLDDERRWYRYHHLFADFLHQRLREREAERIPKLHRRAARWYEGNGLIPEAVDHALAAKDLEGAARLIEQVGFLLLTRSEFATVSNWLEAMPEEFVRSRPWLCIFQAWIVRRAGRLGAVQQLVQDAERALESESVPIASDADLQAIRANIATLHAYIAIFNGEISRAIELSHQALELFPPDHLIRGVTSVTLGLAYRMKGDLAGAVQAFA